MLDNAKMKEHNVGMKRTHIFLPTQMITKLRELAKATGLSVAEHIRHAVAAYLKRQQ